MAFNDYDYESAAPPESGGQGSRPQVTGVSSSGGTDRPRPSAYRSPIATKAEETSRDDLGDIFETSFGLKVSQFPNIRIMVDGNGPVTVGPEDIEIVEDGAYENGAETLVIHLSEEEFARHRVELRNLVVWISRNRRK